MVRCAASNDRNLLLGIDPPFDGAMVLLDDVVQAGASSKAAAASQSAFLLQLLDHLWIRRIAVHINHSGAGMTDPCQGLAKELLGRSCIPVCR
jgi:hypothetical protein